LVSSALVPKNTLQELFTKATLISKMKLIQSPYLRRSLSENIEKEDGVK